MRSFFSALSFLTLLPIPEKWQRRDYAFGKSMIAFPLVGLAMGGIAAGLYLLVEPYFSERVVAALLLLLVFTLSGGLHVDGLMDTVDGLKGGRSRRDILRIMKDSSVGAIGVALFILITLIKLETLAAITTDKKISALIMMLVISRFGMVLIAYSAPVITTGLGSSFKADLSTMRFIVAFFYTLIIGVAMGSGRGVLILLITTLLLLIYTQYFIRRLGGVNGDIMGAGGEISEATILLLFHLI